MAKHGFVDHKQTSSNKSPDGGYARIKAALDGSLQYILSNGVTKNISSPWELPTEDYLTLDPSTLSPSQWERHLVPANAINDWLGHDQDVAQWNGTAWEFVTPEKGWSTYLKSENLVYMFDGVVWAMLSAIPTIEDILYDDFYDKILADALVPGKKYRITNFCSTNMVHDHDDEVYTSPPFMILTTAVSNNEISIDSVDLDNVFDEVYYDPDMTVPAYFWISCHPNNSSIDDEFYSLSSRNEVIKQDFNPYCDCYFLSDHEVRLGTRTRVDSGSSFIIGNNGVNTTITIADPNVSWDSVTGILLLSGGLNFIDSGGTNYYLSGSAIRMASPERRYGVIYWRKNLEYNIEADLDWRHVHWRVYNTSLQYVPAHVPVNGYYSLDDNNFRVQNPDIFTHTITATVDDTDYILKPMFLNCTFTAFSKLSFIRCKGIVFENMYNIENLSMIDCRKIYFWNPVGQGNIRVGNVKIIESYNSMMFGPVKGELNKEAGLKIEASIIDGGYYNSNTFVNTCLISTVNNVTLPRLASVNMDRDSVIMNVKDGDLASIQMYVTTAPQCIIQDSDYINIERSYLDGATLTKFNNYGHDLSHCRFESTITNFNLTNNSIAFNILINFINPIENSTYYGSIDNIDFPEVYNSELKGDIATSFPKVINYDFIDVDAAFTMPSIGLGVYLDSSGGSFDIELPADPYVNQELTFVDAPGQCGTNSVNIVVSTAPGGGTINTINGGASKTIDISYGLLKLRYNTSSGWIIVLESIVQDEINADEMTITKQTGFQNRSDGDVLADDVEKYWLFGSVQNSILFREFIYNDGILYGGRSSWFWMTQSGNTTQFPAGTYEFYASIDLVPYVVYLEDSSSGQNLFTSIYENGLYRHTLTLAVDTLIAAFGTDFSPPNACSIWMIDRFYSGTSDQFSNKNIDLIIDSNGISIDGAAIISTESKRELVTKDYVDKKTGKADEITLEQITADIILDTNPDEQTIFNTAWDSDAQTSGWNLTAGITFLNGMINIPSGTSVPVTGHLKIFDGTTPNMCGETYLPFLICSHDQTGAGFLLTIDDDINSKEIRAFDISVLPNGKYKYSFYIPNGFNYSGISIHTGSSSTSTNVELEFVDMDQYPPQDSIKIKEIDLIIDDDDESIDGSDTPMVDSHRELVTRAFVEEQQIETDNLTIEQQPQHNPITSVTTLLMREWYAEGWDINFDDPLVEFEEHGPIINGFLYVLPGATTIAELTSGFAVQPVLNGIYEFYSNVDLSLYGIHYECLSGPDVYPVVVLENSLFRHSFSFASQQIEILAITTTTDIPISIGLIIRGASVSGNEITIKNIDSIISDQFLSIDGLNTYPVDGNKELVTRNYVDNANADVDDITLSKSLGNPVISSSNDLQTYLHDTWSNDINTGVYTWDVSTTLLNGVLSADGSIINILAGTSVSPLMPAGVQKIISSFPILSLGGNIDFLDNDTGNGFTTKMYDEKLLSNGMYEFSIFFPEAYYLTGIVWNPSPPVGIYDLSFVMMDQYPVRDVSKIKEIDLIIDDDGQSIDGSNTAMVDSHRELITRAFVENFVSNSSTEADDLTIKTQIDFLEKSDSQNMQNEIADNWINGSDTNNWETSGLYNSTDSCFHLPPGVDTILDYGGAAYVTAPAGDYQLYSTIDLTIYDIGIYDNVSGGMVNPSNMVYTNGLYLYTFTLAGTEELAGVYFDNQNLIVPCTIWLINRNVPINTNEVVTIKNIDKIIDSNDLSIDGNITFKENANQELATRDYIDKKIGNADEITLSKDVVVSTISTQANVNLLLNEAWSSDSPILGWTIGSNCSYFNGMLSVHLPTGIAFETILTCSSSVPWNLGGSFKFVVDIQLTGNLIIMLRDDVNTSLTSWHYDEQLLVDGRYQYSLYIPPHTNVKSIHFNKGAGVYDFNMWFYIMDDFPVRDEFKIKEIDFIIDDDNESIDGSDTPMVDSHRELITRAYFHANSAAITDILYDDLMLAFDSSSLTTGQLYRITDFESLNRLAPDSSDVHSSGVLPLIVQAASIDSIHSFVIDTVNEQDMVNYSFNNKFNIYHSWNMWDFPSYSIVDDDGTTVPTNPPDLDNSIAGSGVEWTLGTGITIDMINLVVTADQGVIPNTDMSWNQLTGILSIVSGTRRFDESHSMMGHTVGHTSISVGVRIVNPYTRFGEITYRKDTINNIEATFDFRYHHYYRYEVDMTGLPFGTPANNVDLLARANTSIAIGSSGSGLPTTSYSLTSNSNKAAYPALDMSSGIKYNISLKDVTYTVIEWGDFYNVNMTSVKESTIRNVNGPMNQIENTNIYNAETFFMLDGGGIRDTTYHSVRDHLFLNGIIQLCEFTRIDQQTFYQGVQYVKADCTIFNLCMNNTFGWCSIKAQAFSNSYFENGCTNLTIEAENIGGFNIQGDCTKNTIVTSKSFGIECSGDFKDNTINCGTIANVDVTGDFIRNIVSANWNYVNVQNVIDSKIDTHTEMTFSTQITETDDINFSAISINASKILNSYSMTYVLDTSGGSFDIELPENPSQNTHLIFIDELGNSGTNLVNINQSATPVGGIINTLNGNAVDPLYVLNKDYSYIEMIYTDNGGWILMKESQATLTFDDITIEAPANQLTIKNINYIIDDDDESIDGSDTPMVNSHTELVTREYVDSNISSSSLWTETGVELTPTDPLAESIRIENNHNGYNIVTMENINTGNGAGAVFEAHKTATDYQDNVYMGIYSDNFWIPEIAGKGVLFTDQDLVIGTVDVTKSINFLVGNSYTSPVIVGHLNQNGLYLDTIQTTSVHPPSYHNLFVDASNGLIYASSTGTTGDTPQTDRSVVDATMVSGKTLTLTQAYNVGRQIYIYQNGLLAEDVSEWSIAGNVITFTEALTPLTLGDRIVVKYYY